VSAPEPVSMTGDAAGARLTHCATDIVEIAPLRARSAEFAAIVTARGLRLPSPGRSARAPDRLLICVRPGRWLVLSAPAAAGRAAALWQDALKGAGAAIDHSCGLTALHLSGRAAREVLARGCRLDIAPQVFPAGHAAATIMAQVPSILVALTSSVLLLTPSTTARHFSAWLAGIARPFGLIQAPAVSLTDLSGDALS
jgi:sarcosine oxidase, subunit gamma